MASSNKNKEPAQNKRGPTWDGYYTRMTKTKREKEIQEKRKEKQKRNREEEWR